MKYKFYVTKKDDGKRSPCMATNALGFFKTYPLFITKRTSKFERVPILPIFKRKMFVCT